MLEIETFFEKNLIIIIKIKIITFDKYILWLPSQP